jgi:hypothetical protein
MVRRGIPPVVLALAGIVVLALAGASTTSNAIAVLLLGIACVWAVSLAFFEVGASEDRQRERDRQSPGHR